MTLPSHVDHLVVGAGFSGVALAIGLQQDGEEFLVIEKDEALGGTWWANTYPGATCDIPSHLYSFSFAPNPDWSHAYSPQAEILAYLEKVAAEAGVLDRFHFGVELLGAAWDDEALLWRVHTSAGELTCTTLINATGGLSAPKLPDIEGIGAFAGHLFHTAQWDHDVDLAGRAGGRDRDGRLGHPGGARHPAGGRPPRRLPALGPVGAPEGRPPVHRGAAAAVPAVPRPAPRDAGQALLVARGTRARHHPVAAAQLAGGAARPDEPGQGRPRPRTPRSG